MKKFLSLILMTCVLTLGAACDQIPNSTETVVSEEQKAVRHQAEVLSLASAIGVLQHCRAAKIYTGNPDIVGDTYWRMSGIMRQYILNKDKNPDLAELAVAAHNSYQVSFQTGELLMVIEKKTELIPNTVTVDNEDKCKTTEMILTKAREKGRMLDVLPIK